MAWVEQELKSRKKLDVDEKRAAVLDATKAETLPGLAPEIGHNKGIVPLKFQPVLSPQLFEAEFAVRDSDLVFHLWPWGYRSARRAGEPLPAFVRGFKSELAAAMIDVFGGAAVTVEEVREEGSFFVLVRGAGKNQFFNELAIRALTTLHKDLGGK